MALSIDSRESVSFLPTIQATGLLTLAPAGFTPAEYTSLSWTCDHDLLYRFHQWQANLRVLEGTEIKTVPYVPLSHPFIERLIGTVRREYLDRILFWTRADLETRLVEFQNYYNGHRTHAALDGRLPEPTVDGPVTPIALDSYQWRRHCRGLYQTPIAA
jgi:putative transposase